MNDDYIFVYGTLRRDARHPLHRQLRLYGRRHSEASMQGRLYEVSGYPGAIESADPDHRVRGELYRIADGKRLFSVLDEYEECSGKFPEPREYRRQKVTVRTGEGDTFSAWAYIYCRPTKHLRRIRGGDYLRFTRQRRR